MHELQYVAMSHYDYSLHRIGVNLLTMGNQALKLVDRDVRIGKK